MNKSPKKSFLSNKNNNQTEIDSFFDEEQKHIMFTEDNELNIKHK